jgi:serine/threonine protein kinase
MGVDQMSLAARLASSSMDLDELLRVLERYKLTRVISSNPSGATYVAEEGALRRQVLVRLVDLRGNRSLAARVENEAKALARLDDPHIAQLLDVVTVGHYALLVSEYVDGLALSQVLQAGPLRLGQARKYSSDLLTALAHVHAQQVVHGDVKPANIIVQSRDDTAILIDFGMSFTFAGPDRQEVVRSGSLAGTVAYMAPEIPEGREVTPASDVYSAGCSMYEMLTRRIPFPAESVERAIELMSTGHPRRVVEIRPYAPKPLSDLIAAMMARSPESRPSAEEALQQLGAVPQSLWLAEEEEGRYERITFEPPVEEHEAAPELARSFFPHWPEEPTGDFARASSPFFGSASARYEAIRATGAFYREHLSREYKQLLNQARIAFGLWVGFGIIAFFALVAGIALMYAGSLLPGALTIASEALLLFVQRLFKLREDDYRAAATRKMRYLEIGELWSIALQCIDAIPDSEAQTESASRLADAAMKMLSRIGEDA